MHAANKFYVPLNLYHEKVPMIPDGNVTYGIMRKAKIHWFFDQNRENLRCIGWSMSGLAQKRDLFIFFTMGSSLGSESTTIAGRSIPKLIKGLYSFAAAIYAVAL